MISPLLAIMHKEWRHIVRDKATFIIVLIEPILFSIALSLILSTDVRTVKVVAVVPHHSEASRNLISHFESNPTFRFNGYVKDLAEAEKMMCTNKVNAAVILRPDFEELIERIKEGERNCPSPIQVAVDASNCAMGNAAAMYIKTAIHSEFGVVEEIFSDRILYNPRLLSSYSFQPGIIGFIVMLVGLIVVSSSLVCEKQNKTIDLVILSPVSIRRLYIGKMIPYFFLGLLIAFLTMITGVLITDTPIRGSICLIFLVTVVFVFTSLLLGLLIALLAPNQAQAFIICWAVVSLPVLYFGGVIIPVENLPLWAQRISDIIYVRWYVDALRKLMIQGVNALYIVREVTYMSISAFVFLIACHLKLKRLSE